MKKQYKDLYAGFIIAIVAVVITPLIIKWWQVTLYQPINTEIIEQVQEVNDNEKLQQSDIYNMNKNTFLVPVKSLELTHENEKYYFLRNNDGSLYISDNQELRHDQNYVLEVDKFTDEIINIRFEIEFEFDEAEEKTYTEWFHNDIEEGKIMLNEYLGIIDYEANEISI